MTKETATVFWMLMALVVIVFFIAFDIDNTNQRIDALEMAIAASPTAGAER